MKIGSVVAYLAPEIPSLSATFVYEEMLALERLGVRVVSISVRSPKDSAIGQQPLAARTHIVYNKSVPSTALDGLLSLFNPKFRTIRALRYLLADIISLGVFRASSWKLAYQFLASTRIAQLLLRNKCTHLHVHFAHTPAQLAMYASALVNIPFSVTAHANDIFERGLLLREKAERATKFLTISHFNRRFLAELNLPEEKLEVVRCGVALDPFVGEISKQESSCFRIGTLGRLVEKKGFDTLIRAASQLVARSLHPVQLSIAGDGPLKEVLQDLVKELKLDNVVEFEGALAHHEVANWLRTLDAFVLACKSDKNGDRDGIPVVLMEAMSQSIPVISTNISGIPELVIHENTGLLANPGDADGIATQISRLIESPELRRSLVLRGQEHVMKEFGQRTNIERLTKFIGVI